MDVWAYRRGHHLLAATRESIAHHRASGDLAATIVSGYSNPNRLPTLTDLSQLVKSKICTYLFAVSFFDETREIILLIMAEIV